MEATETFQAGAEQFTVAIDIDLETEQIITGDFSGSVPPGTVGRLRGSIRLLTDLHVRGTLVADPTGVNLDGQNLFDIHTHDGGVLDLVGVEKTAWCRWGDSAVGWQPGDSLVVNPTKVGIYFPSGMTWTGDWATMTRPVNSPDKILVDGTVARPEVINRSQTLLIRNVTRIMMHESGGVRNVHIFKWMKALNCGKVGELTFYPIHFHHLGDTARGSLLEGVLVEGGKNHAFVQHATHGTTLKDCAAYNTTGRAFWWDEPPPTGDPTSNNSHDTTWDHCLAMTVSTPVGVTDHNLAAFVIGAGNGNRCINSVATCVQGGLKGSGFLWSENFVWEFTGNLAHNNKSNGINTWTNSPERHIIDGFQAYHFGRAGIEHGAYRNQFVYRNVSLTVTTPVESGSRATQAVRQYANSGHQGLLFENILTDDRLVIDEHGLPGTTWAVHRNCRYSKVVYIEVGTEPSKIRFEDCDLEPVDFNLAGVMAASEIEIVESGVVIHRWAGGWT